jgi:hypothetical protein
MTAYQTRPIRGYRWKSEVPKGARRSAEEMELYRRALYDVVTQYAPMTVRQVCYQAEVRGLIGKSEADFEDAAAQITQLRHNWIDQQDRNWLEEHDVYDEPDDPSRLVMWDEEEYGELPLAMPLDWIIDEGRHPREIAQFDDIAGSIVDAARRYRRSIWQDEDDYVEVWVEKDTVLSIVSPVLNKYGVRFMSGKGFSSLSLLNQVAKHLKQIAMSGKNIYIYQFGDFDPSGVLACYKVEEMLERLGVEEFHFERAALTPQQIEALGLLTRPTKIEKNNHYPKFLQRFGKEWAAKSCELEALLPGQMRDMLEAVILQHLKNDEVLSDDDADDIYGDDDPLAVNRAIFAAKMQRQEADREVLERFAEQHAWTLTPKDRPPPIVPSERWLGPSVNTALKLYRQWLTKPEREWVLQWLYSGAKPLDFIDDRKLEKQAFCSIYLALPEYDRKALYSLVTDPERSWEPDRETDKTGSRAPA